MNDFRFHFDCYKKARKKTRRLLFIIYVPLIILICFPILWYAMDYTSENILWQSLLKLVLYILNFSILLFIASLTKIIFGRKILKYYFNKLKNQKNESIIYYWSCIVLSVVSSYM